MANKFTCEKERIAVDWAKRTYKRRFKDAMRQRLNTDTRKALLFGGAPVPLEKFRYRPYGHAYMNEMLTRAAHWYRRNFVMRGGQ